MAAWRSASALAALHADGVRACLPHDRINPEKLLLAAALHVPGGRAQGMTAALLFEGVLAALHMAFGALLDLLNVVAGFVHVLLTECADHKRSLRFLGCGSGQRGGGVPVPSEVGS